MLSLEQESMDEELDHNYGLSSSSPFDISEKVKHANRLLAEEGQVQEHTKSWKVKFKEQIIDLEIFLTDFSSEEEAEADDWLPVETCAEPALAESDSADDGETLLLALEDDVRSGFPHEAPYREFKDKCSALRLHEHASLPTDDSERDFSAQKSIGANSRPRGTACDSLEITDLDLSAIFDCSLDLSETHCNTSQQTGSRESVKANCFAGQRKPTNNKKQTSRPKETIEHQAQVVRQCRRGCEISSARDVRNEPWTAFGRSTKLPNYNGFRSEYGLSKEQLQEKAWKRKLFIESRREIEKQNAEREELKRVKNAQAYNMWLTRKKNEVMAFDAGDNEDPRETKSERERAAVTSFQRWLERKNREKRNVQQLQFKLKHSEKKQATNKQWPVSERPKGCKRIGNRLFNDPAATIDEILRNGNQHMTTTFRIYLGFPPKSPTAPM